MEKVWPGTFILSVSSSICQLKNNSKCFHSLFHHEVDCWQKPCLSLVNQGKQLIDWLKILIFCPGAKWFYQQRDTFQLLLSLSRRPGQVVTRDKWLVDHLVTSIDITLPQLEHNCKIRHHSKLVYIVKYTNPDIEDIVFCLIEYSMKSWLLCH